MEENKENIMEQDTHTEFIEDEHKEDKKSRPSLLGGVNKMHLIVEGVLLVAVIVLFILHFVGGKGNKEASSDGSTNTTVVKLVGEPGNGSVLYVNLDTIYECKLFEEKQAALDVESSDLEQAFTSRQQKLESDYAQFQKNMNAGILTEAQMQYTYSQLETENNKIREDYQKAMESLAQKQADLTSELLDALREAARVVNAGIEGDPASYVITYSSLNPMVIVVDPTRDITAAVVAELNKKCSSK